MRSDFGCRANFGCLRDCAVQPLTFGIANSGLQAPLLRVWSFRWDRTNRGHRLAFSRLGLSGATKKLPRSSVVKLSDGLRIICRTSNHLSIPLLHGMA